MIILSIALSALGFVIGFIIGKAYQIRKSKDSRLAKRVRNYIDSDLKFTVVRAGGSEKRI